jgi:hypothetical protein
MYSSVILGYGVLRAVIFFEKADKSSPCEFRQHTIKKSNQAQDIFGLTFKICDETKPEVKTS